MDLRMSRLSTDYNSLTQAERGEVRDRYVVLQDGDCFYCDAPLHEDPPSEITSMFIDWDLFPPGFLNNPVHLQHDHETGWTMGAVHAFCNAVMWQYEGR